ncbi:MAG: sigma-70 family RNA polymerase sigma factor [Pseudomonadota bacterium]|nr:MAG: sigma-70 family RNA polymerase sigma factor [Pseudomonadota bacterium]
MPDPRCDDELMLAYAGGDVRAFEMLHDRYRQPLYRYLVHAVGDRTLADDLYQEVWAAIIDHRDRFRRKQGFRRYAFRIAHNRVVDHWRRRARQGQHDSDATAGLVDEQATPERAAERHDRAAALRHALMSLPVEQRSAFLLQQEAGLSLTDIAERQGVGHETIKSRLRYAVRKLRERLSPDAQPEPP